MSEVTWGPEDVPIRTASVFTDKKADDEVLTKGLIKSAKRTGQLSLCNRGLGIVPENVWKIDELVLDETKDVDFDRTDTEKWWNAETLKTLDLSSNAITTILPEVKRLQDLVTLKLHDNALNSLPDEIGQLKFLTTLSLDHNKLSELPPAFYYLTELRWLSISYNQLSQIKPDFGDLVMLTYLDLSHNKLTSLPPGLGYLVRLLEINLSHNSLEELPPDIVNMRELRKMNVSDNRLSSLPPLGELRRMTWLEASRNRLESAPDCEGCAALADLRLAHNSLAELSEEFIEQVQHVRTLDLQSNGLRRLPDNVALLRRLARLDLANNQLNDLPSNLGLLSQLQSLRVDGNRLAGVRGDVRREGGARLVRALRDRLVDDATAHTPPQEMPDKYSLRKCQTLSLAGRALSAVPGEVLSAAAAAEVHTVDLARNALTELPSLSPLSSTLTQLTVSHNRLSRLPAELAECRRLLLLDAAGNRLADLPPELADLTGLKELVLDNNLLVDIPPCVFSMSSLEVLSLSDNRVTRLPATALAACARLAVLRLGNNALGHVPPELGTLTHLMSVELRGNPFRQPRHAVLERGTAALLSYLRDRLPAATATATATPR